MYLSILTLSIISCSSDDAITPKNYEFISAYSSHVTVGGVVGIKEVYFKVGEIYSGIDLGNKIIKIRITEHTELNTDCPNSWCYQEFLEVPQNHLKIVE